MAGKQKTDSAYNRIVAKLGTSLLTGGGSHLDQQAMADLVGQIASLHRDGRELLVVSSGAIGAITVATVKFSSSIALTPSGKSISLI